MPPSTGTKSKTRRVNGKALPELQAAWRAWQQAEALHRAAYERWERLLTIEAKRSRIPVKKCVVNLQTGEVTRRG